MKQVLTSSVMLIADAQSRGVECPHDVHPSDVPDKTRTPSALGRALSPGGHRVARKSPLRRLFSCSNH